MVDSVATIINYFLDNAEMLMNGGSNLLRRLMLNYIIAMKH